MNEIYFLHLCINQLGKTSILVEINLKEHKTRGHKYN